MLAIQQPILFTSESSIPSRKKNSRIHLVDRPQDFPKSSKPGPHLLTIKQLLAQSTLGQQKEASRLQQYGNDVFHRYLQVSVTRKPIANLKINNNSTWDKNELLEELPDYWEKLANEFLTGKPSITAFALYEFLFPHCHEVYENLEGETEIVPMIDPYDAERTIAFLAGKLKEWHWTTLKNPRIFFNPSLKYETIVLKAKEEKEFKLTSFAHKLGFECNQELIRFLKVILDRAGFESYLFGKDFFYRTPLFFI